MRKQRGVTMIGWVFLLIPMAIVIYAAVYLYSFFVQRKIVGRIIELTSSPPATGTASTTACRRLRSTSTRRNCCSSSGLSCSPQG